MFFLLIIHKICAKIMVRRLKIIFALRRHRIESLVKNFEISLPSEMTFSQVLLFHKIIVD